jgi:uncharacterized protein (DUF433 family)
VEEIEMADSNSPYVIQSADGAWRVIGTRVSLDSIVHAYWEGRQPEAIAADFPSLSLEQIHGALAFYLRNQAEIDAYLAGQDEQWRHFQKDSAAKHGPLLQRVRGSAMSPAGD